MQRVLPSLRHSAQPTFRKATGWGVHELHDGRDHTRRNGCAGGNSKEVACASIWSTGIHIPSQKVLRPSLSIQTSVSNHPLRGGLGDASKTLLTSTSRLPKYAGFCSKDQSDHNTTQQKNEECLHLADVQWFPADVGFGAEKKHLPSNGHPQTQSVDFLNIQ